MLEFIFDTLSLNTEFIKFILTFISKNPHFYDYANYRWGYLIPIAIAFLRNKSNLRLISIANLTLGFIGISILDFVSKHHGLFIFTIGFFVYLIPAFIALFRNTHNLRLICICNLVFGITGISWLVILIWAIVEPENKPNRQNAEICPRCKGFVRPGSSACNHCHQPI